MRQQRPPELRDLDPAQVETVRTRLLDACFPPAERLTADEIREIYLTDAPPPSAVVLDEDQPIAVMLTEWFCDRRVLLLSYLAVTPAARGHHVGEDLIRDVLPTWSGDALVLAEVEDPRSHGTHPDWGDPAARLRYYGRLGADLLPLAYFQPSLRPGAPRVTGMLLLRLGGRIDPPDLLRTFLVEYFDACEPGARHDDAVVVGLLDAASDAGRSQRVWPTDDYARIPQPAGTGHAGRGGG